MSAPIPQKSASHKRVLQRFLLIIIPLTLLLAGLMFFIFYKEKQRHIDTLQIQETQSLRLIKGLVSQHFELAISELLSLSDYHELKKYLLNPSASNIRDVHNDWMATQSNRGVYESVRFIDETGMERIRVNYVDGASFPVPADQLQNKAQRYYFDETIRLGHREIYISPLDLNVEHGRIDKPYKPVIRISTPVFDHNGQKRGILILNFLADSVLRHLRGGTGHTSPGEIMLVNQSGYYLLHPQAEKEWGFMIGREERFGLDYPDVWSRISDESVSQFQTRDGLFTSTRLGPIEEEKLVQSDSPVEFHKHLVKAPSWQLVSLVPDQVLREPMGTLWLILLFIWFGILFIMTLGAWRVASEQVRQEVDKEILKDREETIKLLLNSTAGGIYGVDPDGRCTFINRSALELLGYDEAELVGLPTHNKVVHTRADGTLYSQEKCQINDVIKSGNPCYVDDGIFWKSDGSFLNVEYWIHPIFKEGKTHGVVITFVDISEKKKIIEQRIRSGQLTSLGELASGVAHEINNPIGGVINYAQILLNKKEIPEADKEILGRILKEGNRVAAIVSNLLQFVHKDRAVMTTLSLADVLDDTLPLVRQQLDRDGILLDIFVEEEAPLIVGNAQELGQILLNLISNARHALNEKYPMTDTDKILRIAVVQKSVGGDQQLQLIIWDQGTGIPGLIQDKVFNRFFTTKPAGVGTGLGLSIVHEIIEKHGGLIKIESGPGEYTQVVIAFPLAES